MCWTQPWRITCTRICQVQLIFWYSYLNLKAQSSTFWVDAHLLLLDRNDIISCLIKHLLQKPSLPISTVFKTLMDVLYSEHPTETNEHTVLVCQGCHSQMPQTLWLKLYTSMFSQFQKLKVQDVDRVGFLGGFSVLLMAALMLPLPMVYPLMSLLIRTSVIQVWVPP